jgi:prepilin-type N-terminal cleavage/methylation domain-containing protein
MWCPSSDRGFTLFETLVATSILVTALAGLAQLFVLSSQFARQAGVAGAALVAAQDKLETLRGHTFAYDSAGAPVTDSALLRSPSNTLAGDVAPYVDWLDPVGVARSNAQSAVLVRRWRISPVDAQTPDAIAIEVCVYRVGEGAAARWADACLSTIRTRQP